MNKLITFFFSLLPILATAQNNSIQLVGAKYRILEESMYRMPIANFVNGIGYDRKINNKIAIAATINYSDKKQLEDICKIVMMLMQGKVNFNISMYILDQNSCFHYHQIDLKHLLNLVIITAVAIIKVLNIMVGTALQWHLIINFYSMKVI